MYTFATTKKKYIYLINCQTGFHKSQALHGSQIERFLPWWYLPSKHARSDSEAFQLQPVMAITLDSQNWAKSTFPHLIRSHSSKQGPDHIVQNQPGSNLDSLVWFRPNTSGLEASRCVRITGPCSGRVHLACYQFLTFRLICVLPQTALIILCKTRLDPVWFWLTVPNGSSPEASQCARITRPASGNFFCANPDWMRHVYWLSSKTQQQQKERERGKKSMLWSHSPAPNNL